MFPLIKGFFLFLAKHWHKRCIFFGQKKGDNTRGWIGRRNMAKSASIFFLWCCLILIISCSQQVYTGLLTYEEYYQKNLSEPYILELNTEEEASLLYYGSMHTTNLDDPQFVDIEKRWIAFKPTVAYSESCVWPLVKSIEGAISRYGEQGLLRFLASRHKVPIKSIDPTRAQEAVYLKRYFGAEQIKIFYVLRQVVVNRNLGKDTESVGYVNKILRHLGNIDYYYRGNPHYLDEFEGRIHQLFPNLKDWKSISCFYFRAPNSGNFLLKIHRKLNEFRDQHMLRRLLRELGKGSRIFAVVGRSHVVVQEPVLRAEVARLKKANKP